VIAKEQEFGGEARAVKRGRGIAGGAASTLENRNQPGNGASPGW